MGTPLPPTGLACYCWFLTVNNRPDTDRLCSCYSGNNEKCHHYGRGYRLRFWLMADAGDCWQKREKFLNPAPEVGNFNDRVIVKELPVNPDWGQGLFYKTEHRRVTHLPGGIPRGQTLVFWFWVNSNRQSDAKAVLHIRSDPLVWLMSLVLVFFLFKWFILQTCNRTQVVSGWVMWSRCRFHWEKIPVWSENGGPRWGSSAPQTTNQSNKQDSGFQCPLQNKTCIGFLSKTDWSSLPANIKPAWSRWDCSRSAVNQDILFKSLWMNMWTC